MKKILCFSIALFLCMVVTYAQTYPKVKITMKNGGIVTGSKGTIDKESISFTMEGSPQKYSLSDVSMIQSKKGSAGKWALGCGAGCLGFYGISYLISPSTYEDAGLSGGQVLFGALIWAGVSAGVGALIGAATDHYEIVYSKNLSMLKQFNLDFSTNQMTRYTPQTNNFTLSYRF
jgi:hypothetical protein